MQDENAAIAGQAGANGQAEFIAGPDGQPSYISTKEAIKKYGVTNSSLYGWKQRGRIAHDKDKGGWLEVDVARLTRDPKFRSASAARKKVLRSGRGMVKRGPYKPRAQVAAVAAVPETHIAYHVAYLAGRTDDFISGYARAHQVDERDLARSLGGLLLSR